MMDIIHGENSPLMRVSEDECEKKKDILKNNMHKAFNYSLGRYQWFADKSIY